MERFNANLDAGIKQLLGLIDLPSVLLFVLLVGGLWMALRAQRRDDFDWANALRDENGKESALRLAVLVALAVSSAVLMKASVQQSADLVALYVAFLVAWSGAPIARELVAKWNGVLPWSKP